MRFVLEKEESRIVQFIILSSYSLLWFSCGLTFGDLLFYWWASLYSIGTVLCLDEDLWNEYGFQLNAGLGIHGVLGLVTSLMLTIIMWDSSMLVVASLLLPHIWLPLSREKVGRMVYVGWFLANFPLWFMG